MTERGNPAIRIRLEPELADESQKAFPAVKGRSGGLSLAIRRLLYLALDKPMPKQYGETWRAHGVDELEELVREIETGPPPELETLKKLQTEAQVLLEDEVHDAVDVARLRAFLGRVLCPHLVMPCPGCPPQQCRFGRMP